MHRPIVRLSTLTALLLCAATTLPLAADEVRLLNGDHLTGTIAALADGHLELETEWGGTLQVDWAAVRAIASDDTLTLVLADGSRLVGTVEAPPQGAEAGEALRVTLEEGGSPVTVALAQVQTINPPESAVRVTGNASAGLVAHQGNTETQSLYMEAEISARTDVNRYTAGAQATRAEDDGETTADSSRGWIEYDHFFGERWYVATSALFTRDEFQDLRLRSSVALSAGYQLIETEATAISAELGASSVDEDFYDARDDSYAAGRWAIDLSHRVAGGSVELFHHHEGLVDFGNSSGTLVRSKTGARFNLFGGFLATTQINFDYDGDPAPGREKEDWRYLVNLGFEW